MSNSKTFRVSRYSSLPDGPVAINVPHKTIRYVHSTHASFEISFTPSADGKTLGIEVGEYKSLRSIVHVSRLPTTGSADISAHQRITQDGKKLFFKFPVTAGKVSQTDLGIRFQITLERLEDVSLILSLCLPFFHITTAKSNNKTHINQSQTYSSQVLQTASKSTIPSSQLRSSTIPLPPIPAGLTSQSSTLQSTDKSSSDVPRSGTAEKRKTSPVDGLDEIKRKLMRNYVPDGGPSGPGPENGPSNPGINAPQSIYSQYRADTVRMTSTTTGSQSQQDQSNYQMTPHGTMQDLGQASQMIQTQYNQTQDLVDLLTPADAPISSSGLDFPPETISYLPGPTQSGETQDLISFEDPLGEMSQLNDEDREAIESTYPPMYTGSEGTTVRATPKPSAGLQDGTANSLQSDLFELAGVAHLYAASPAVRRTSRDPTPVTNSTSIPPLHREVVRQALVEYLKEEGFRQMVSEVASVLREQFQHFSHYDRLERRHQYSYTSGANYHDHAQAPYEQEDSSKHRAKHSQPQSQDVTASTPIWYQPVNFPHQGHTPWHQNEAAYPQQYPDPRRSLSRSFDPWTQGSQAYDQNTQNRDSMIDDDFEAMMAEPCE